jgi:hypothetical protein
MSQVHNVTHVPVHSLPLGALAVAVASQGIKRGNGLIPCIGNCHDTPLLFKSRRRAASSTGDSNAGEAKDRIESEYR